MLGVVFSAGPAQAAPLPPFGCITNNNIGDCTIGQNQLSADLTGTTLMITMAAGGDAVVEQVFIEGAGVTSISFLGPGAGSTGIVSFGTGQAGGNLPGGNQPSVNFVEAVNISANNPKPKEGIGPHPQDPLLAGQFQSGEFTLGGTLSNLRVGVHVIGYASGGSESFVTGAPPVSSPVPEPGTLLLIGTGLVGLGAGAWRRKK